MDAISLSPSYIKLSQELLYAVKTGSSTQPYLQQLKAVNMDTLQQELADDTHKKAFWINLYNALVQVALSQNPAQYQNRSRFFQQPFIAIGPHRISLDLIEHGILRRSQLKWGLGYLTNPFATSLEKKLRVATLNYRIHFALNCGAQSCPPIAFYTPEKIDVQLDMATANYLQQELVYVADHNKWLLPAILSWFRGDFGGRKGIRQLLQQYHFTPPTGQIWPKIAFKKYDWSLRLSSFTSG
jgi:Protein of unknown function, DUF547